MSIKSEVVNKPRVDGFPTLLKCKLNDRVILAFNDGDAIVLVAGVGTYYVGDKFKYAIKDYEYYPGKITLSNN